MPAAHFTAWRIPMKNLLIVSTLAALPLLGACEKKPAEEPFVPTPQTSSQTAPPIAPGTPLPPNHPAINMEQGQEQTATLSNTIENVQTQHAVVVSTIDIPQFTYLEVKQGSDKTRWLAAATLPAKKGDTVMFDEGSTMSNFTSTTLHRTFSNITFVNNASIKGK
jgi:hypothetical protein